MVDSNTLKGLAEMALFNAEKLHSGACSDREKESILRTASDFLKRVEQLETVGVEHSDAMMISLLLGMRNR